MAKWRRQSSSERATPPPVGSGWRRPIAALVVLVVGAGLGLVVWNLRTPPLQVTGPIILISIDTLRADRLPAYGYAELDTPAIDALAADGVVFEHAYSHAPQTLPAHTSMFTGKLPFEHAVRDNLGFVVGEKEMLLPELLASRGYTTAAVVSSYVLRKEVGLARAFDVYDDEMPVASPGMSIGQVQRDGADSLAVTERWLDTVASPFFLFLHLYDPHTPYSPPDRFAHYGPYNGEIAYADEIIGQLFDSLRARGLYDNALIILLSDHGEGLADHGEEEHGIFLYDEVIRVPLIVKLPNSRAAGLRVPDPVQHIDLLPTLLDLVGAEPIEGLRGRSLRPLLEGDRDPWPARYIYSEALYPRYHFGWSELYALTSAQFRFVKAPSEELYDLIADPDERENLVPRRARTVLDMRTALDELRGAGPIEAPAAVSDEVLQRLRSLGYFGGGTGVDTDTAAEMLPDPKDKVGVLEQYRTAVDLGGRRQFDQAIALLQLILADNPEMADVWQQLGNMQTRNDQLVEALSSYQELVGLKPTDPTGLLAVASAQLRLKQLDDAWEHGMLALEASSNISATRRAHEQLVRIALARRDREAAQRHAALARDADPTLPLPTFVQARMLHEDGRYADALLLFEQTLAELRTRTLTLPDLHFYLGDTLARLDRAEDAEVQFLEELRLTPHNGRARAGLAMLYQSEGRSAEAAQAIRELLAAVSTPEGYRLAAELWDMFGARGRAAAVRSEATELFGADRTRAAASASSF